MAGLALAIDWRHHSIYPEVSVTLPAADPETFVLIKDYHAGDTNRVYYDGKVISKAPTSLVS